MSASFAVPSLPLPADPSPALLARGLAPTPLGLGDLLDAVRRHGAAVADGTGPARPVHRDGERWFTRLHADPFLDVWLITWPRETSTELHDHAGSLGALTVVSGTLLEHRWTGLPGSRAGALRSRTLPAGRGAGFPLGHVHDVVNAAERPAVSVHAYSPPLSAMSYYAVDAAGHLLRTRSVLTDEPEER